MTQCTFPSDFTVPVVIADRIKTADYDIGISANQINDSVQCVEAVTKVLCDSQVQPKCLGNGMVAYEPGFPQVESTQLRINPHSNISLFFISVAMLRLPSAVMRRPS